MTTLLANIFDSPEEENEFLRRNILVKELVKKTFSVFNISGKNSNLGRLLKNDKDYFSLDRALKLNKRDFVAFCEFQDFILGDDFETQESSSAWCDIFNIFGIDGMRTLVAYDKNIALQLRNIFSFRYWYDTGSMEGLLWKDRIEIIETELNDTVENWLLWLLSANHTIFDEFKETIHNIHYQQYYVTEDKWKANDWNIESPDEKVIKSDEMYHRHMKEIKDFFSNLASKRKEWYTKIVFDYDDEYHDLIIEMGEDFSRFIQKWIANEILNKKEKIKELDKDFTLSIAKKTAEEQRLNNTIDKLTERLASLNGIKKEYYKKVKEEFEDTFSLVKGNENLAERALRVLEALKN